MNFHTFELSYKLSTDDVRIIYNELYNASGQNYKPKDDCAVFKALQDYGIIIFIKNTNKMNIIIMSYIIESIQDVYWKTTTILEYLILKTLINL